MACSVFVAGCATARGDITRIETMPSNVAAPSRPVGPTRPLTFPAIALLVDRGAPTLAMTAPATEFDNPLPTPAELPEAPALAEPSTKQSDFNESANRAVSRVEIDDYDDDAILLSLREQLDGDPELAPLQDVWTTRLNEAIERAVQLRRLRVVLRRLKSAFADAKLDKTTSLYTGLDIVDCRRAFSTLLESYPEEVEIEVTVPSVGRKPLLAFNELCETSHQIELAQVEFPEDVGSKKKRRLVRRAFRGAYPDLVLKKLSVTERRWAKQDAGRRRELQATVGVLRNDVYPEDPCVMQDISIHQTKIGGKYAATECCDIRKETPILCELLE